ncbi:ATP-binding cassette domain-containing protein [Comamonas piscis]|uniref:ATP-binding cassette domain-containing protein n=1 Tax=Comamonas piscis TaxID=1562974 RepID=A0A7G5EJA6_9BURK|nr:ATP-binding cassette domain-containing protein [Comamonas piscis]QMV74081.1 ATP-binding cassette domain-containing protein [Comamonas piscis]WSO32518.1 ATP-binding cassette domain-containing protein [Comamonas piscis]
MKAWNALRPIVLLFAQSPYRRRMLLGSLLAAITVCAGMSLLGLSGWFLTASYVAGLSTATAVVFDVFAPGAGVRFFSMLRTGARYSERVVTHDATLRVLAALRVQLFSRLAAADTALALRQRPARLLHRLTADIDALDAVYLRLLTPAVSLLVSAALTALALTIFLNWQSGLLVGAMVLAGGLACVAWCVRHGFMTSLRRSFAGEQLRAAVIDAVGAQTELVMAGGLQRQMARIAAAERQQYAADIRLNRLEANVAIAMAMVGHLATAAALLCAAWLAQRGEIGAPIAALATLLLLAALEPLTHIRRGAIEASRTLLAARRIAPLLEDVPTTAPENSAPAAGLAVDMQAVSIQHPGSPAPVLQHFDLQVADGEWLVLAGPSGAGKSSLMALIGGDLAPSAGQVLRLPCASLPQRTELFQAIVADNLRLGRPDASDDELWAALQTAGLAEVIRALPQQLNTPLGSQGAGLSGGESRRLALARLLLHPGPLALLDEPTEGLDRQTANQVMTAIAQWHAARSRSGSASHHGAIVMASHLQREARHADRIVWIDPLQGRLEQARQGTAAFDALLQRLRPG